MSAVIPQLEQMSKTNDLENLAFSLGFYNSAWSTSQECRAEASAASPVNTKRGPVELEERGQAVDLMVGLNFNSHAGKSFSGCVRASNIWMCW